MSWIKVVPDALPNDDGLWLKVPSSPRVVARIGIFSTAWEKTIAPFIPYAPSGTHIVAVHERPPALK